MPATRTISSLSATITQASLATAIQTAFTNAGFSAPVLDATSGTDRILAYAYTSVSGSFSFNTVYLRLRITSTLGIFQQLSTGIPSGGTSGTNASTEVSLGTLVSTTPCTFNSLNSGNVVVGGTTFVEYRLIFLVQGSLMLPLGLFAPINRRGSWSLNSWSWAFIFTSSALSVARGTNLNQYASADLDVLASGNTRLGTSNPSDNERDVLSNLILLTQSNQGSPGRSSDDLAIVSANGSSRYDTIPITGTSQQYLIVNPGSGGFAVRIT
jgi:hypothetical protein